MTDHPFDVADEFAPLSGIDEFMVHNSPLPIRVNTNADARSYERMWFTNQDGDGDYLIVTGIGFYPNLGTADAFAVIVRNGQQTSVRSWRALGNNRMNMVMGPIRFENVEPFKHWKLSLLDNPSGITYEIHWYDTKRSVYSNFAGPTISQGRLNTETAGYETFGVQEGWVAVDGERKTLSTARCTGTRDHHWGTRNAVGGPGYAVGPIRSSPHGLAMFDFKDWALWAGRVLRPQGDPRPGAVRVLNTERYLAFEPETTCFTEGVIRAGLETGEVKEIHVRRIGHQMAFLRCGGYPPGAPDDGIWHGMKVEDGLVKVDRHDLTRPEVRAALGGLVDNHCEVSCDGETTHAIYETFEPMTYEGCRDRVPGYRLLETLNA